jgi:hypothetical protein
MKAFQVICSAASISPYPNICGIPVIARLPITRVDQRLIHHSPDLFEAA